MVAQDKHGVFCVMSGCGWKVENEDIERLNIDQPDME